MSKFGEWECWSAWESWNDEKFHLCWYVTEIGTQTYIAKTDSESDARLIASAPEMYSLIADALRMCKGREVYASLYMRAVKLLKYIDGKD